MKNKTTLVSICLLVSVIVSFAQQKVAASDIMQDIRDGKKVSHKNTTIVGTLDFTFLEEAIEKLPKTKKNSWFNWISNNSSNVINKNIETRISFVNCTFKGNVLAYIPDEDSGYTFTASFDEEVLFKDCTFERKAMFKYSKFEKNTDFSGSKFEEDSTFKYAKFDRDGNFYNTAFNEVSTFKYARFKNHVNFSNSTFKDTAIFKYTKFLEGVSFKNTNFEEDLDIKYANVSGDFDISGMKVAYDIDSKYTKINGKTFNKDLIDED